LDVGYNRLREKGIRAITEGFTQNAGSKLKVLGIRYNFINDDGFGFFFEEAVLKKKQLEKVYCIQNYMSEHFCHQTAEKVRNTGSTVYVDQFDRLANCTTEKQDRSIWISPINAGWYGFPEKLKNFFQKIHECGLVLDVRLRKGPKI